MGEMSLSDIQQMSLAILQDIHTFCMHNNIRYSLAYGTLIGAIRHKGFIPWDDDIDIMMPRPDYNRFCAEYTSPSNRVISHGNASDCMIGYARVCDMQRTIVGDSSWSKQHTGVWVDVFPIDGTAPDIESHREHLRNVRNHWYELWKYRVICGERNDSNSRLMNAAISLKRISLFDRIITKAGQNKMAEYISLCSQYPFGETGMCGQFGCPDNGDDEFYKVSDFDDLVLAPFAGGEFCISGNYDAMLSSVYGDYMQLPPESEQVPKQSYLKFYWK